MFSVLTVAVPATCDGDRASSSSCAVQAWSSRPRTRSVESLRGRCAASFRRAIFLFQPSPDARVNLQGELHVSTIRMVFINHSGGDMQAFDLPMANITNEKFNQPIFGANNISGTVAAVRAQHTPYLRRSPSILS